MNFYSRLWERPLTAAARSAWRGQFSKQNWLTVPDVVNLLHLCDFRVIRGWQEVLCPFPIPAVAPLCNRVLVRLWGFRHLALANFLMARPLTANESAHANGRVSVVVPARNEAGNISAIFTRTPEMGLGTELIFVEGHSSDDTYAAIERAIAAHPARSGQAASADRPRQRRRRSLGFAAATGDILMILDADLTVPPEDLPRFYEAIRSNKGEFINGVRLMYPMEERAMRFANLLGNKFFSLAFTWLLGQSIKDTLAAPKCCGGGLRRARSESGVLRRLRSIWRLRSAVRRGEAGSRNRGAADPVSGANLRRDEHPAMAAWLAASENVPGRRGKDQVCLGVHT